jgi:hypothetical protein
LPTPFGPTTPIRLPAPTVSETPLKTSFAPYETETSTSVIELGCREGPPDEEWKRLDVVS